MRPTHFDPRRIYLAKGSLTTPERRRFVQSICGLYPDAKVIDRQDVPHNRINLGEPDARERHRQGKRTLVFGAHASAVRFSKEEGNTCPNYWHFSPYGYCPYACRYCYLAGTTGFWHSPTVRIYVNLEEIVRRIDRIATLASRPTAFYCGKLQDGLALDPLTAYSTVLVPFFARHPYARQVILTKSANVERLFEVEHAGHTILTWSLNPPEVIREFEDDVPPVEERLAAMRRCAERGYPLRAVLMPIIPVEDWESVYEGFLRRLLAEVPLQRLTMGGICSYRNARVLMDSALGPRNVISSHIDEARRPPDGRARYSQPLRIRIYAHIARIARKLRPDLELALCLEEPAVWKAVNLEAGLGRCNCVL